MKAKRKTNIIISGNLDGRTIYLKDFITKCVCPTIIWSEDKQAAKRFLSTKDAREFIQKAPVHRETELIRVPAEG